MTNQHRSKIFLFATLFLATGLTPAIHADDRESGPETPERR